ncbi:MAG TPA: class I SAM-dependent methyltransferase [Thermoanaerobaculia bacterium]|nr:class I SAM-dependent methyltransferase [Thermoanaerobaculia bacterium]
MSSAAGETPAPGPSFFDDIARDYDAQMSRVPGDLWMREAFQEFVIRGLAPGEVVLDFGCGTGVDARVYSERGFRVIGYDSSVAMTQVAANRCGTGIGGNLVEIFSGPYEEFLGRPWSRTPPSAIVSNFAVLNLVPSLRAAFARFHEILQPGGSVFLSLLNPCYVRNLVTPGLRRLFFRALRHGITEFPSAKVPTLLYRERFVRQAAEPFFALDLRAGVGAVVNHAAIAGSWREPRGWRERIEHRFSSTRVLAGAGKFTFLKLRRRG